MDTLPRDDDGQLSAYAWPGGYPIYYLDYDNSLICAECARRSDQNPEEITRFKPREYGIFEEDGYMVCENCGQVIGTAPEED